VSRLHTALSNTSRLTARKSSGILVAVVYDHGAVVSTSFPSLLSLDEFPAPPVKSTVAAQALVSSSISWTTMPRSWTRYWWNGGGEIFCVYIAWRRTITGL